MWLISRISINIPLTVFYFKNMKKLIVTCDCCLKEIEEKDCFSVDHYVHVSPSFNRMQGHCKIIDGKTHSISGRTEKKDFCLPCYNLLFNIFFKTIKDIQVAIPSMRLNSGRN